MPENESLLDDLLLKLNDSKVGMVGPIDYYFPLKTYLNHNYKILEKIMRSFTKNYFEDILSKKFDDLGFFAGTMFWVDISAIGECLGISKYNFPPEKAQTDGTISHALERVFCLLPQLKDLKTYGISKEHIIEVHNKPLLYPQWYLNDVTSGLPRISVIVPVYADWVSLRKNIKSLKKYFRYSDDVDVYYVNDCGPDANDLERKILNRISGEVNFYYSRNEQNLGFVKTCNRGVFEIVNQENDILLLNSDTKVTRNFIYAMRDVLYSEQNIAAVTSRSNNATVWSVPMSGRLSNHRFLSYVLYVVLRQSVPDKYITPTIHGFCVLIRREVLDRFGLFDEIYGKGYGEENDFAMRVKKNGWKCAVANKSFVFHYESRSFGKTLRDKQIQINEEILTKRYPEYRTLVQEYWDNTRELIR